jgi:hypothetical protein
MRLPENEGRGKTKLQEAYLRQTPSLGTDIVMRSILLFTSMQSMINECPVAVNRLWFHIDYFRFAFKEPLDFLDCFYAWCRHQAPLWNWTRDWSSDPEPQFGANKNPQSGATS